MKLERTAQALSGATTRLLLRGQETTEFNLPCQRGTGKRRGLAVAARGLVTGRRDRGNGSQSVWASRDVVIHRRRTWTHGRSASARARTAGDRRLRRTLGVGQLGTKNAWIALQVSSRLGSAALAPTLSGWCGLCRYLRRRLWCNPSSLVRGRGSGRSQRRLEGWRSGLAANSLCILIPQSLFLVGRCGV